MGNKIVIASFLLMFSSFLSAQSNRWQQAVKYKMDVDFSVKSNQYKGTQKLTYTNNSPDTLKKLFYHLYFNAFQPESSMDVRSRRQGAIKVGRNNTPDWDARVKDRIQNLQPDEIGFQKINSLKLNGIAQPFTVEETILMVQLNRPILPKQTVVLDMQFEAQVPLQIRRSGRDNPNTKVRYSMSQWYPKLCEYDNDGWHPNPYVGREFYGVWGDFEVNITIDKTYMLGGTGYLLNANQIGYGYEDAGVKVAKPKGSTLTWKFIAPNVHDFMWAADPNYKHISKKTSNGTVINVLYINDKSVAVNAFSKLPDTTKAKYGNNSDNYYMDVENKWKMIVDAAITVLPFIEKRFGAYPYKQYSFIQGGDGGMEYPMATLLAGPGLGTVFHEWMHSWYQMMLGTNEALYAWMDEGFTEFATNLVEEFYTTKQVPNLSLNGIPINAHSSNYNGYFSLAKSGLEEPLTTHADHFNTNFAYSSASYNKGCVFLEQLGYIIGSKTRDALLLEYYRQWHFKHPNVNDFVRLAEKQSGIELDWYKEYFVNSTKTIDYKIDSLWEEKGKTKIRISKVGLIPMPLDILVTTSDNNNELHYIPLNLMYAYKQNDYENINRIDYPFWKWTHPTYIIETTIPLNKIVKVEIDPSQRMADIERKNNKIDLNW